MSLIVCPVSRFVLFQYRQSISRARPTHLRGNFLISQNPHPWKIIPNFRITWTSKRSEALLYFKKKLTWFCFLFCADEQPGFRLTWISGAHLNCVKHLSWIEIMGRRGHVAMKMITDMITRLKCLVIPITQVSGYKPSELNRARTSNLREKFGVKVEHPVPHDHWLHCQCLILYPYLDHI